MRYRSLLIPLLSVAVLAGFLYLARQPGPLPPPVEVITPPAPSGVPATVVEVVAEELDIPWEVVFLPDNQILVTERPGTLFKISPDEKKIPIQGVHHQGEGGLLGLAVHPAFKESRWIYLYLTTKTGETFTNRVERYRLDDDALSERKVILPNIPGAAYHDGGRIEFGPDGHLYVATGDANRRAAPQNTASLAGKILRVTEEGAVPADNPFNNPVWSYGHRNPQGLAWDDRGRLWATEHGRSGVGTSGYDEINLIEKGANYGWPDAEGDRTGAGMRLPVRHSGPDVTWAPAGTAIWKDRIFFSGLKGESLYEARINADGTLGPVRAHFTRQFGRVRAVALGPDGYIYFTTSNRDGRTDTVRPTDDKLIRVRPENLTSE